MFPVIYDSKVLAAEVRKALRKDHDDKVRYLHRTGLSTLSQSLSKDTSTLFRPAVSILPHDSKYTSTLKYHEAGFDAYQCGKCFIFLAHTYASLQLPSVKQHRPMSWREHLGALRWFSNRLHVARAMMGYVSIPGDDMARPSIRPPWLVVQRRDGRALSPAVASSWLLQLCNAVDVRPHSPKAVLVAPQSWDGAREILRTARVKDSPFSAVKYSVLRHSAASRSIAISGLAVTVGLGTYLIYKAFRNMQK